MAVCACVCMRRHVCCCACLNIRVCVCVCVCHQGAHKHPSVCQWQHTILGRCRAVSGGNWSGRHHVCRSVNSSAPTVMLNEN